MKILFFILTALIFSLPANSQNTSARTLVHLLDYIAADYPGAISNGKVINQFEYNEQLELISSAVDMIKKDPLLKKDGTVKDISRLQKLVQDKKSGEEIARLSQKVKNEIILLSRLETAPREWPDIKAGKAIFEQSCVSCHGTSGHGDGPGAGGMEPKPTNFHDLKIMSGVSPFKIFNATRVGIAGTAMGSFPALSDKDLWAAAFYVSSLRHTWISDKESEKFFEQASKKISLKDVASLSDDSLETLLANTKTLEEKRSLIASLRLHTKSEEASGKLTLATYLLHDVLTAYKENQKSQSREKALSAYLEGIEPIEPQIKARDPQLLIEIETAMGNVRGDIEKNVPYGELEKRVKLALDIIQQAENLLAQQNTSSSFTFFMSFSILLREGFEAVLVIIALLGVIRATKAKKAARWVHGGWISAVFAGLLLWFFSGMLLDISGAQREMMEGVVSLIAVVILLYMGFWLHSISEIKRWNAFIKERVEKALSKGSLFGLAFISFTAVAREALETVLFLRAIWLEDGQNNTHMAIPLGVASAFILVFIFSWALLKYSAKIPIRKLFSFSSAIMALLSFMMVGKAVHSIQEAGKVSITDLPLNLRFDFLGIYPTAETLGAQLLIVLLIYILWNRGRAGKKS